MEAMTTTDLDRAKASLLADDYACVLRKGDIVHTSRNRGIAPMMDFIATGVDLQGFSAADRVVGKAAALLFVLAGVAQVHACVISRPALDVFTRRGMAYSYDDLAEKIINRTNTGPCPMEQAVSEIDDPADAFEVLKRQLESEKQEHPATD
jgi:hypothetical protein